MTDACKNPIRILCIDNHALMRAGIRKLIEEQPNMTLVGEAGTTAEALVIAAREKPDIILLDPNLKDHLKLDLICELMAAAENARVILVTGQDDPSIHQQSIEMGAMGVVSKEQSADVLMKAVIKVHAGEIWLGHDLITSVIRRSNRKRVEKIEPHVAAIASLSQRQLEVVTLVGEGLKNKQIADRLSIGETTVRHHLTTIFEKLNVSDRMELMVFAYRHGLAKLPD